MRQQCVFKHHAARSNTAALQVQAAVGCCMLWWLCCPGHCACAAKCRAANPLGACLRPASSCTVGCVYYPAHGCWCSLAACWMCGVTLWCQQDRVADVGLVPRVQTASSQFARCIGQLLCCTALPVCLFMCVAARAGSGWLLVVAPTTVVVLPLGHWWEEDQGPQWLASMLC